ncbi:hypothetical protein PINS_up015564 [Pythium insidiosum]|nr:hypothetical protein PINS_up015564 [Pythium insidiosum]
MATTAARARATRRRGKTAPPTTAESDDGDAAVAAPARKRARQPSARSRADAEEEEEEEDAETDALLAAVGRDTRKMSAQRKRASGAILAEFTSLDALLSNDMEEKQRKRQREMRLQRLRAEVDDPDGRKRGNNGGGDDEEDDGDGNGGDGNGGGDAATRGSGGGGGAGTASTLARLMNAMEHNMSSLSADDHLFTGAQELPRSQEKFGFVFTPMTEPLPFQCFKATATELAGELSTLYRALQTKDDEELAALLWSRAILMRCQLEGRRAGLGNAAAGDAGVSEAALLPSRIGSWLFLTMSTHSNSHIVKGCLNNLVAVLLGSATPQAAMNLLAGLPCANVCSGLEDMRTVMGSAWPELQMEWRPTVYDFLNAFRRFGFQDSKRSMSAKSKISAAPKTPPATGAGATNTVPFPTLNMQFVLAFLVLSLRTNLLRLDGYDAFSFTMFFLRMQFEHNMHPEIVQLASVCIEELLEVFPALEWRREWAPSLVLRIAGASEGLFDSAAGWLAVARRLPRTTRGTQLTTGLSIYVLQHRIDKTTADPSNSEKPLKFPIPSGLVLDIVAGIVDDLTVKYAEAKAQKRAKKQKKATANVGTDDTDASNAAVAASAPTLDLLCKKVALMDLALQAFLNILTQKEMAILLKKLDELTGTHKSTMSAKWHELKTLVSLMHRKYSLENLRIGRDTAPLAKTALFVDESTSG